MRKTNRIIASAFMALSITITAVPLADAHCGVCGVESQAKADSESSCLLAQAKADSEAPCSASQAKSEGKSIVEVAQAAGSFNTLLAAAGAAGLSETLSSDGPYTVFAPTDEAFAKLPEGTVEALLKEPAKLRNILLYHVVPGLVNAKDVVKLRSAKTALGQSVQISAEDGVRIDNAKVVKTDIEASNGVIHVIDRVILPKDIVGVAANNGQFSTLVAAIKAAGLAETLSSGGPFTVFAPTNDAFGNLPDGTLENLLKPENKKQLQEILKYHVVPGNVSAEQAMKLSKAQTVQGEDLTLSNSHKDGLKVDNASVIASDILALNGIIHVIDAVLLPES